MLETIVRDIQAFFETEANRSAYNQKKIYEKPLVGFADARDPLFEEYKAIIGGFHLTPGEWFEGEYGRESFTGGTVISWVMPISADTITSNRQQDEAPSGDWAFTRYYGEIFNDQLKIHVAGLLRERGFRSVVPSANSQWKRFHDPLVGWASTWSERHAAYAAGLGTFSLTDGLITAKGIAHRCGSVITELVLPPTLRPYKGPYDYCLSYQGKECGVCIDRCPAGAIDDIGHDKDVCEAYVHTKLDPQKRFGLKIAGCGLCQTKVPCERGIPDGDKKGSCC